MRFLKICTALILASTVVNTAIAEEKVVDFSTQQVMPAELALVAVYGEVCSKLIKTDQAFQTGYQTVIGELLAESKNPIAEFKLLTESNDYKEEMATQREFVKQSGNKINKEVCLSIQEYGKTQH